MITVSHLLILSSILLGLRLAHHYLSKSLVGQNVHCPCQLAAEQKYEAPPRDWMVICLVIRLIIPRLALLTGSIGSYLILIHDFGLGAILSTWFTKPGWEWKLPIAFSIGVLINLVITVGRLCSRRLREDALKDLEHSHAILILTGAQALEALLPLAFAFLVIPMLGLPSNLEVFLER
jgi:hypothetical protein